MEEHQEYGTVPKSTFSVLLRSTHLQEYVPLPRSTFYLGGAHLVTLLLGIGGIGNPNPTIREGSEIGTLIKSSS